MMLDLLISVNKFILKVCIYYLFQYKPTGYHTSPLVQLAAKILELE